LKALNQLWNLKLSSKELMQIGGELGADIPFCIMGGTALAQGIGEKLMKLQSFANKYILLCNPGMSISTAQAYSKINPNGHRLDIDGLANCIEEDDIYCVASKLSNKMEEAIIREYPMIQEIKDMMMKNGALGSLMSGSGPTVFGLFDDKDKMISAKKELSKKIDYIYLCQTI